MSASCTVRLYHTIIEVLLVFVCFAFPRSFMELGTPNSAGRFGAGKL